MADDSTPDPSPDPDPTPDPASDPEPNGDGTDWKAMARKHEREKKQLADRLARLEDANLNEVDRLAKEAREEGRQEAFTAANERILRSEVKALAAGKLANPEMAARLLDLSEFTITDDGDVDTKEITKALDALLVAEPYLAAGQTTRPGVPVGARGGAPDAQDMNARLRQAAGRA